MRYIKSVVGALGLATLTTACGPSVAAPDGQETAGCVDGECLGDLVCRMDQCVDPSAETDAPETDTVGTSTSGSTTSTTTTTTTGSTTTPSGVTTEVEPPSPASAVDVLFVVDDSSTMAEEQGNLALAAGDLVTGLQGFGLNVRLAVTTSDNGALWCTGSGISTPEAGSFVASSCLSRLEQFSFLNIEAEEICTANCSTEVLPFGEGPWLDEPTPEQAACLLPQGINGCGFESQLESMWKGLQRTTEPSEPEFGFLRPDAHLLIVILSDEADCSLNPAYELDVLGPDGNRVFWSLPDQQNAPTSAACWNAGVQCFGDPSAYDGCEVATLDTNANPAADENDAVMQPLSKYANELQSIRALKAGTGGEVFVFGILGVPEGYAGDIQYSQGPDGQDPESFQASFGIAPGCATTEAEAIPPVRMRALIEDFSLAEENQIYSVCESDFGGAFSDMAARVGAYVP